MRRKKNSFFPLLTERHVLKSMFMLTRKISAFLPCFYFYFPGYSTLLSIMHCPVLCHAVLSCPALSYYVLDYISAPFLLQSPYLRHALLPTTDLACPFVFLQAFSNRGCVCQRVVALEERGDVLRAHDCF